MKRFHPKGEERVLFRCGVCLCGFSTKEEVYEHRRESHVLSHAFELEATAHNDRCQLLKLFFPDEVVTLDAAFFYVYDHMKSLTYSLSANMDYFRINFTMTLEMEQLDEEGNVEERQKFPFRGFGILIARVSEQSGDSLFIEHEIQRVLGDIERNVDEFLFRGSGWRISKPIEMEAEVVKCKPIAGGSNRHEIRWQYGKGFQLDSLEGCESDGLCLYFAVAEFLLGEAASHADLSQTAHSLMEKGGFKKRPVKVKDLDLFEKLNADLDLAINVVYKDEDQSILPVRASKRVHAKGQIVLILFDMQHDREVDDGKETFLVGHYALVRNPSLLFARRYQRRTSPVFICYNCFNTQTRQSCYLNHIAFCHQRSCQKVRMPLVGDVLSFAEQMNARAKSFKSAFSLYYDFESLQIDPTKGCSCPPHVLENTKRKRDSDELEKSLSQGEREERRLEELMLQGEIFDMWQARFFEARQMNKKPPNLPTLEFKEMRKRICPHKTFVVKEQPAFAYSYLLVNREGEVKEKKTYVGADAAHNFILSVLNVADEFLPSLSPGKDMENLSRQERDILLSTHTCYLCQNHMDESDKVLDHDHLTGSLLGVAHSQCNLQRREEHVLTCFAHNFSGYDGSYLMQELHKFPERIHSIKAIPLNMQKMKTVTVNSRIRFMDSYGFLSSSLATLVSTLRESESTFPLLSTMVGGEGKELLLRKGVYPYSYATSIEVLRNTTALPTREEFFNDVSQTECTFEDYEHARRVWSHFKCRHMIDYTVIYLKGDVYLLADVMQNFRNAVWKHFELDLHQYLSLPHIAMDAMLKMTGVEIDLISDQEMSFLLQSNIRGGHSFVNLRHSVIKENDDDCLLYLDCNNLYGMAMSLPLPLRDFRWMSQQEIDDFEPTSYITWEEGPGYILEVDLDYPRELHLLHNSFPLAPESVEIGEEDLSPYGKECLNVIHNKAKHKARKLTATFRPR